MLSDRKPETPHHTSRDWLVQAFLTLLVNEKMWLGNKRVLYEEKRKKRKALYKLSTKIPLAMGSRCEDVEAPGAAAQAVASVLLPPTLELFKAGRVSLVRDSFIWIAMETMQLPLLS